MNNFHAVKKSLILESSINIAKKIIDTLNSKKPELDLVTKKEGNALVVYTKSTYTGKGEIWRLEDHFKPGGHIYELLSSQGVEVQIIKSGQNKKSTVFPDMSDVWVKLKT